MTTTSNGSSIRNWIIDSVTLITAVAAIVVTTVVVKDHRASASRRSAISALRPDTVLADAAKYAESGHRIGPENARMTIVEFGDYQCPYCARFEAAVDALMEAHPGQIALVFRDWPIPGHTLARPAVRAALCADRQGRYAEIHRLMFRKQDSLGVISFADLGRRAGVADQNAFDGCLRESTEITGIAADSAAAVGLRARGTPTVIVNSVLYGYPPDSVKLAQLLKESRSVAQR